MNPEPDESAPDSLERQIATWRTHLRRSQAIANTDAAELEDHLREQIDSLVTGGLAGDEAFLVAVKRLGAIDALTREFAREHSERLWKQLVLAGSDGFGGTTPYGPRTLWLALALAVGAAAAIKLPALVGLDFDPDGDPSGMAFYLLNLSFFTLPFIAAYFALARPLARSAVIRLAILFALAAIVANAFPFSATSVSDTRILTTLHLPIALWLVVGAAYVGGRWHGSERRMDFVRFTGELFIYYVLIALGGMVLIGSTFGLFQAIGVDVEPLVQGWIVPCGIVGAAVVATWLVEAKQSVVENMAPVLTRLFSPLFVLLLLGFMVTMLGTGRGFDLEREILIAFDLLLVVVFGLMLYSISARDPLAPPGLLDWIQLTLAGAALAVDVLALWAVSTRISDFGFTPNRIAALGENVVLLANLAGSAVLYVRFLHGAAPFSRLLEWQTGYLYVLVGWTAIVSLLFPLLFGFQ